MHLLHQTLTPSQNDQNAEGMNVSIYWWEMWISRSLFYFVSEQATSQAKQHLSASMYRPLLNTFLSVKGPVSCLHPSQQDLPKPSTLLSRQTVMCKRFQWNKLKGRVYESFHLFLYQRWSYSNRLQIQCHTDRHPHVQSALEKVLFIYLEGSCIQVTLLLQCESWQNVHRSAEILKEFHLH